MQYGAWWLHLLSQRAILYNGGCSAPLRTRNDSTRWAASRFWSPTSHSACCVQLSLTSRPQSCRISVCCGEIGFPQAWDNPKPHRRATTPLARAWRGTPMILDNNLLTLSLSHPLRPLIKGRCDGPTGTAGSLDRGALAMASTSMQPQDWSLFSSGGWESPDLAWQPVAHFIQAAHRDRVRRNCETLGNSKDHDKQCPEQPLVHCPPCLPTMLLNVDHLPSARRNESNNTGQTDLLPAAIGHTRDFAPQMIRSNDSGSWRVCERVARGGSRDRGMG